MAEILDCPICKIGLNQKADIKTGCVATIHCPNCGPYNLSFEFYTDNLVNNRLSREELAILSYSLRRMQGGKATPWLVQDIAMSILNTTTLPAAMEQIDNLIIYLGTTLAEPGAALNIKANELRATLGSITLGAAQWVIGEAHEAGLIQAQISQYVGNPEWGIFGATLSVRGWQRYTELQTSASGSKRAFMAMKFGDDELTRVFQECFRVAAQRAGFNLMKLDDEPRAGLIDDRLRVEIRTSRFVIADLSHANKGAYWEAGFAEGLGRPVIYTCRDSVMNHTNKDMRPHFDTNHHLIIVWSPDKLQEAADRLATTIRATLPGEAKLVDD